MNVQELKDRVSRMDITPVKIQVQCPDVSPSQASKWLKQLNSKDKEPTKICYWFFEFLCDRIESELGKSKEYHGKVLAAPSIATITTGTAQEKAEITFHYEESKSSNPLQNHKWTEEEKEDLYYMNKDACGEEWEIPVVYSSYPMEFNLQYLRVGKIVYFAYEDRVYSFVMVDNKSVGLLAGPDNTLIVSASEGFWKNTGKINVTTK